MPQKRTFVQRHSLSLFVAVVLVSLLIAYSLSNQHTHTGSFFGNAIADWSGLLVIILATKRFYEKGSAESRNPPHPFLKPFPDFVQNHSLTIFLLITGTIWVLLFRKMDVDGKWGGVVGNIVSEWTQIIGTVLLTKKLTEIHSKESKR